MPAWIEGVRWTTCALLAACSILILVGNPIAGIQARRSGKNYSSLPFLGGVFGCLACLICPAIGLSPWALLPLALDYTFLACVAVVLALALMGDRDSSHG